ncbi:MAG: hypothetical protein NZ699_16540 [Roseiflexus sp.]|nr:hypothetical protein [Roseiflexus sp.]MCS7290731.1 hypothetical protein [Roseiflexus sp.]MDW8147440.1 hypothetical protein [Roseiflexaceae bacterium]MDW8233707.1 hypothetical protein [Roseiflexaceae bacterium]
MCARALTFQDDASDADTEPNNRLIPPGRAMLDQVLARGARGDRVYVFAERQQWVGAKRSAPETSTWQ